jgi:hypothetical protein
MEVVKLANGEEKIKRRKISGAEIYGNAVCSPCRKAIGTAESGVKPG